MKHALLDAVAGLSRRQVLGFAGAAALSACGGGGASGASPGRISVVAGSATGTGPVEQAIGQIGSMAFDPATGGLVVNCVGKDSGGFLARYPARGHSVDMGSGVQTRYASAFTAMTWGAESARSTAVVVDSTGNAYCSVWIVDEVFRFKVAARHGDVRQVSPAGQVVSLMAEVGAGTPVLPERMALLPDGTLAFIDILSGWLMRWQVGKGLTRLVPLFPGWSQGVESYFGGDTFMPVFFDLVSAPNGVYVLERMQVLNQAGAPQQLVRVSLWNSRELTVISDIAVTGSFDLFRDAVIVGNSEQLAFAAVRGAAEQPSGFELLMALLQSNVQVRTLDVSALEGGSLPEVVSRGVALTMAFAPDGALWIVRKFGASGGALLRIELPS